MGAVEVESEGHLLVLCDGSRHAIADSGRAVGVNPRELNRGAVPTSDARARKLLLRSGFQGRRVASRDPLAASRYVARGPAAHSRRTE